MILREVHDFKWSALDKHYNPYDLKQRVNFLNINVWSPDSEENEDNSRRIEGTAARISKGYEGMQSYSALFFRVQVCNMVLKRTLEQWQVFNRLNWQWMSNVVMGENCDRISSYHRMPRFGLQVMITSISGVQQVRSQSLL